MLSSSQKGMWLANPNNRNVLFRVGLVILLSLIPESLFSLSRILNVQVDTVWVDEQTTIRGITASFPFSVLTRVKVYDENNHYVPMLASEERWLGLNDTAENGQLVRSNWPSALEYHVENNSLPKNPDVKSNPEYFGVTEVRMHDYELSIMIVMDYSKSMDDVSIVEQATADFIEESGGRERTGIVKFSDDVKVCQAPTTSLELLEAAIFDSTINRGQTVLFSAIDTAITHLSPQIGRRVVIVYTDGKNDVLANNQITIDELIAHAKASNVELFVIGLGGGINETNLKKLASQTNGKYFFGEGSKRLDPIYLKIYGDLRGFYIMRHMSPDPFHNGTWRWVEVEIVDVWKGGKGRAKYYVPYFPPAVSVSKTVSLSPSGIPSPGMNLAMGGDTVTYTILLQNTSKGAYPEIKIVDMLDDSLTAVPEGMLLDQNISLVSLNANQIVWNLSRLDGGESAQILYRAVLDSIMPIDPMALTNQVRLEGSLDFNKETDLATIYGYAYPDFIVNPSGPALIASPGQKIDIRAAIINQGNAPMDRPFRISFEYAGQVLAYDTLQTLNLNETKMVSGRIAFENPGEYTVVIRADADQVQQEQDETNNTAQINQRVAVTALTAQISDVQYKNQIRQVTGSFPSDLLTTVHVLDQNAYPVHGLASSDGWSSLETVSPYGAQVANIWLSLHETYRDDPGYPPDSDVRPGMEVTELTGVSASWVLMVSTGGVSQEWLDEVRTVLISMANRMQTGDRIAVMASHGAASQLQSFTASLNAVRQGLEKLTLGSGARVFDNFIKAIDLAAGRWGRNAVLAVLGSREQASQTSVQEVIEYAQMKGVPLYILNQANLIGQNSLQSLALASGGYHWTFEDTQSFHTVVDDAERLLRNYYVLHHFSSDTLKNLSWRQLDVRVDAYGLSASDTGVYRAPKGLRDLSVAKTLASSTFHLDNGDTVWTAEPGGNVRFHVVVTNEGDFPMAAIQMSDSLPGNLRLHSPDFDVSIMNQVIHWTIDTLRVGESAAFNYSCFVDTLPELVEVDLLTRVRLNHPDDESTDNNTDLDTLRYLPLDAVDLVIKKSVFSDSSAVVAGDTLWQTLPEGMVYYRLSITNQGEMPALGLHIDDVLPQYLNWRFTTQPLTGQTGDSIWWEIPRLDGHDSNLTWIYACQVDSVMPPWDVLLVNQVTLFCADDSTPNDNFASASVNVVGISPPRPFIDVSPGLVYPLDSVEVNVTCPFTVNSWDLTVVLGDGTVSSNYADAFISATQLIPDQRTRVNPDFTETARRTAERDETIHIIFITVDEWDVVRSDTASIVVALPDVYVSKSVVSDSLSIIQNDSLWYAKPGETVQYTLTLTNMGRLPCHQLEINDNLAPNLTFIQFEPSISFQSGDNSVTWQLNSLEAFAQVQFQYTCLVDSLMPPWVVQNDNRVSVTCDRDADPDNNTDTATLYVAGEIPPDPTIWATPSRIEPGDSVAIRVMSPIYIEPGHWNLTILFEDGTIIEDYADATILVNALNPGDTLNIFPEFDDTRMRTVEKEEQFQVVLETTDGWSASYFDTTNVILRSGDAFFLNENVFHLSRYSHFGMRFRMSSNRHAKIMIYDLAGSHIATLVDGPYLAGWNETSWQGLNDRGQPVGSGVYVAVYQSGDVKKAHKFIVIR
jgi:uncharacterized repeat protein (TIGR01451 family)